MSSFPYDIDKWVVVGILAAGIVAFLLIGTRMRLQTKELEKLGYGIGAYELAVFRRFSTEDILAAWGQEGRRIARDNLVLDFWFIPAYVLLGAGVVLLAGFVQQALGDPAGLSLPIGWQLVLAPLVAGGLDAIENLFLLSMLRAPTSVSPGAALAAGVAAAIKFALLGVAGLVCLSSIILHLVQRFVLRA